MFSDQDNESTPSQLLYSISKDVPEAPADGKQLLPEQIRQIIRLFQCQICSYPLRGPVTLPCGKTLCKTCIPETHARTNISYPADVNRLRGFECPFSECAREHAIVDCASDVVMSKAVAHAQTVFERWRQDEHAFLSSVEVTVKDQWAITGISSLREPNSPEVLQGGKLLATYTLAERGGLEYYTEIDYITVSGNEDNGGRFDVAVLKHVKEIVRTEMDCQICYAMYYDPVTTACGHTFCRECLQRVMDHSAYCPVCRRGLTGPLDSKTSPPNELLRRVITCFWSDELKLRKQAILTGQGCQDVSTPIFVCTMAYPSMPTFLHVFEPRYRLMIRRALEADRCFGMVLHRRPRSASDTNFTELGTLLQIANVEFFPDGRSVLETIGVSRFKITHHSMLDGYVTAKTEKIHDISIAEEEELEATETRGDQGPQSLTRTTSQDTPSTQNANETTQGMFRRPSNANDLKTMPTRELMDFAVDFVSRMREQSVTWLTNRMTAIYGDCPRDPSMFPWWFGCILPVTDEQKYLLLGTASVRERLKICCRWILEWELRQWYVSAQSPRS